MEQVPPQGSGKRSGIRGAWLQLTLEVVVFVGIALLLALVARKLPGARPDAGVVYFIVLALHGFGVLRFAQRAAEFFELECAHCSESFHGRPDRLPRPFRSHCASCGVRA